MEHNQNLIEIEQDEKINNIQSIQDCLDLQKILNDCQIAKRNVATMKEEEQSDIWFESDLSENMNCVTEDASDPKDFK